jgi:hypothetical protein
MQYALMPIDQEIMIAIKKHFKVIETSQAIADTGHPQFPGWEIIIALLVAATIAASISGALDPRSFRAPKLRSTYISRLVRSKQ